jgi:hypothetical protein
MKSATVFDPDGLPESGTRDDRRGTTIEMPSHTIDTSSMVEGWRARVGVPDSRLGRRGVTS